MEQAIMNKRSKFAGLVILAGLGVVSANAETVTYDVGLVSPDTNPATNTPSGTNPSWYNGSGNQTIQGGWTVATGTDVTGDTIEIGLQAILRQVNSVIDTPTNTYIVPYGTETNPPAQSNNPNRDAWNYQFSIDLNPGGNTTGLTLSGITAVLTITDANNPLNTVSFDPTAIGDDSGFGTAGGMTLLNRTSGASGSEWGAQNSENPLFGGFPKGWDYNPNVADNYTFTLDVYNGAGLNPTTENSGNLIASDTINVDVVTPEPSTLILLASGGLLLLVQQRRRSARGASSV
jgi:hypothetical protein